MNSKGKYIGVSNRIPFEVIESSLYDYIKTGAVDKDCYLKHIGQFTKGENRANKILNHLSVILNRNEHLIKSFKSALKGADYFQINVKDRKAFILCLFCLTYPITFEILTALSLGFKVQEKLNRQYLLQKIGFIYGSNKAMQIAVEEVIPLLIECGLIVRVKIGLYKFGSKIDIKNNFVSELVIFTDIKLSGSKSILIEDLRHRPWYFNFELSTPNPKNILVSKKDSAIGKGYLTIPE